uniref:Secreted protein n=1 Tax=Wuchereria bancrofti TaxID=6293 RepID=A0AAF5PJS6_WUCBA
MFRFHFWLLHRSFVISFLLVRQNCGVTTEVVVLSETTDSASLRKAFVHTVRVILLHFIAGILHLQLVFATVCTDINDIVVISSKVFMKLLDLSSTAFLV